MSDVLTQISSYVANNAMQLGIAAIAVIGLILIVLVIVLIRRKPDDIITGLQEHLSELRAQQERME